MQEVKEINKVVYLSNNDILPNRFQPRKYFDEEEIMQLSESIKEHGVINPIIVRKLGDKYELVAGERRYKANILAGNDDIPAIIMDVNDKESSEIAVVENIQRKDLNAIEEAISYKRILDIGYMTQEQLAQKMGKSQSSIANKIRLLKLSDEVQDALMKKQISERHARSLLKLESQKKQNELLERIINERLTVRKTDEEIEKMNNNMNNFNNIYNNVPNNSPEQLTPIMPGANVTDVNISGGNSGQIQTPNNGFINSVEPVMPGVTNVESPVNVIPTTSVEPQVEQPFVEPQQVNNQVELPTQPEPQVIPTVSIDDVLAKANQPSVVGNQSFGSSSLTPNNQVVNDSHNNNYMSLDNNFEMPNLSPINEEPTPISGQSEFSMPELSPINEMPSGINNQSMESTSASNPTSVDLQSNINEPANFEIPSFNSFSRSNESTTNAFSFENNMDTISNSNNYPDINESMNTNTFNYSSENNDIASPITTSPIIDTTTPTMQNSFETGNDMDNISIPSATPENTQQFERVPEPIIVNDYNDQYDPIMPAQQTKQPTVDLKTIISLIRKCSQAIENSGYKIETEEYNLDNLYQVVFKIEKQ